MHHAARQAAALFAIAQKFQQIAVGISHMQLHGHFRFIRQIQMPVQGFDLLIARGRIFIIIQPRFADADAFGQTNQAQDGILHRR